MTTTTMPPVETPTNRLVHKIRVRALLFFALALVAGVTAAFLVKLYMDQARRASRVAPLPTRDVVVAVMDVPIGTRLEPRHLGVVKWPGEAPAGAFPAVAEVIGRSLIQDVVAGESILASRLADPSRGVGMAAILTEGRRAMAVKVDQVIGVAGFVHPGDFVDVIATVKPDDDAEAALDKKTARMAKTILQNIRVLAIGQQLASEGSKPVPVQVVTLEVTPAEAEKLALASQHGKINLTMRSRVDQTTVETAGATPATLLADEDAAVCPPAPPPVAAAVSREDDERAPRRRRTHRATRPPEDKPPVVEILRGAKVEERTLRPSRDAE